MLATSIDEELKEMGFKGMLLEILNSLITDAETMQELYNFIILQGEGMTKFMIVHEFEIHLQNKFYFE